jgi:hypothetical protein
VNIPPGLSSDAVLLTAFQKDKAILGAVHDILTQSLDEDARVLILSNDQRLRLFLVLEEIIELLIIDLQERAVNGEAELWVIINLLLELNEDLVDGLGDDAELA